MKGYKAFNYDMTCQPVYWKLMHYEVGKTYEMRGLPRICYRGFHFCRTLRQVYNYYQTAFQTRICEIESIGNISASGGKVATNRIRIIRELTPDEIVVLLRKPAARPHIRLRVISESIINYRWSPNDYQLRRAIRGGIRFPRKGELPWLNTRADEWEVAIKRVHEQEKEIRQ